MMGFKKSIDNKKYLKDDDTNRLINIYDLIEILIKKNVLKEEDILE